MLDVWITLARLEINLSINSLVSRNPARWFTWKVASKPSSVIWRSPMMTPALLTSTSICS